ncbi:MAG: DUF502 domain-containing protein [Candidatus Omnitrophica bacterium]|nr:DUF502 domain-containing protein [Candidatus Omnitrophota bacterium]
MENLKKYFWSGLLSLIPITFSVWILIKLVIFLDNLLGRLIRRLVPDFYLPGLGFISLIAIILFVGFLAHNIFGKKTLILVEKILHSVPILNKIYSFSKAIMLAIARPESRSFRSVVTVKAFGDNCLLGFVTAEMMTKEGKKFLTVFVPTVPNPTTGFLLIIPEEKTEKIPLTVEEGFSLVVSMGLVRPDQWPV